MIKEWRRRRVGQRVKPGDGRALKHFRSWQLPYRALSRLPAAFPVPGGTGEVRVSAFGLRRCHYVTDQGPEYRLASDPHSAEGRRARLE